MHPTGHEVEQLLAVRAVLAAEAARLAAQHAGEDEVRRLRRLCADGEAATAAGDVDGMVAASTTLHECVTELSGNPALLDFVGQVDLRVSAHYPAITRQRGAQAWQEHHALVDAIERKDPESAARIMRDHVDHTRAAYLQTHQPTPTPSRTRPAPVPARRRRTLPRP
ncbi:GntR family transcriptional regulator [Amycolatopsis magusensis]|uniref:DNA-binding GntR family transcriptional regulator n=1 Tax=Amycolatopsis magusensis TaxID=882444 RepID=A0ABS4Q341_9PSEU|nr:FCD domain-containing protein [Amycolatopsis magusensis]MBP2186108.1 DNA-binding GntR family transcriptional regulator [Amycolatopsis magusensis]